MGLFVSPENGALVFQFPENLKKLVLEASLGWVFKFTRHYSLFLVTVPITPSVPLLFYNIVFRKGKITILFSFNIRNGCEISFCSELKNYALLIRTHLLCFF